MAKEIGETGFRVFIAVGQDVIPTEISNSLTVNNNIIDASDKGSGGWTENLDGRRDWALDVELNYDPADTVVSALIDKMLDPTTSTATDVTVGRITDIGDISYSGSARISSIPISGPDQELITLSLNFVGNGALTKDTKTV